MRTDLVETGTYWDGAKREVLDRLGWRSVRSCVGLRSWWCTELLLAVVVVVLCYDLLQQLY